MSEVKKEAERIITGCIFDEDDFNNFQCCYGNDEKIKEHTTDCQALAVKCLKELLANDTAQSLTIRKMQVEIDLLREQRNVYCGDAYNSKDYAEFIAGDEAEIEAKKAEVK